MRLLLALSNEIALQHGLGLFAGNRAKVGSEAKYKSSSFYSSVFEKISPPHPTSLRNILFVVSRILFSTQDKAGEERRLYMSKANRYISEEE